MDEVKKYDANVTDYNNSSGGNLGFQSSTEKGDFKIDKMYKRKGTEGNELKTYSVSLSRNIYDDTEEENIIQEKVISLDKYIELVNKKLAGATFKKFNGSDTWELDGNTFSLSSINGDGSDIQFEVIKY